MTIAMKLMRTRIVKLYSPLVVAFCMAWSGRAALAQDSEMKVFKSPTGGFSVEMPGIPEPKQQTVETKSGNIEVHMFVVNTQSDTYYVSYTVYPPEAIAGQNPQALLDKVRNAAVASANCSMASELMVALQNHPGREVVMKGDTTCGMGRFYLVKNRLYQVLFFTTGTMNVHQTRQYLDSFKLTDKEPGQAQ